MSTYRFPVLLCEDPGGFHSAMLVESLAEHTAGFGVTAAQALEQVRDFLTWLYRREPERPAPELRDAELITIKVPVRPEYQVDDRIYASEQTFTLRVHCVRGRLVSGLRVAAVPLLDIRFYYHEPDSLKNLVIRYVQQGLKGLTPRALAQFLPPPLVHLEELVIHARGKAAVRPPETEWPTLSRVAEPLGQRGIRKQYGHPWGRDELVRQAVHRLHHDKTHLLLVGEPGTGKTTILVEAVQSIERMHAAEAQKRGEKDVAARLYWLTSAGRLIAGMKYLGQWEERCEQLIAELSRIPGVLCVERLLDLLRLGGAGPGDSVAAFLVPYLQRGELRLVSETSPAELDSCRRLLPGFVDLFPILPVPPLDRPQVFNVLDRTATRLAQNLRLEVAPGVSDRVYHLYRRFLPYRMFPGAACGFVRDVCERHARHLARQPVTSEAVVAHFIRQTGLPDWLLRDDMPLDPLRLRTDLAHQVIGQDEAVQAAAQLVVNFKAGLNDPTRPIGVLLFSGPTGVGKTELARTLARTLFGHGESRDGAKRDQAEDRLVRLDMSEYAGADALERLLGPPHGEPGELIRCLRQQPFCVVLLDEIEKASPSVFDTLLGVCDEGRLTDRFGRTTSFQSSIIVMTSNLGAERQEPFGFGQSSLTPYHEAVREFFRPEFFNRLDAVLTFQPLRPATIRAIALKELQAIAEREGFRRAGVRLAWSERIIDWLAREGFDARYGARPLQRVLERHVVTRLAKHLLAHPNVRDLSLEVDCDSDGKVQIRG